MLILLDTNVILNAAFIPSSSSRKVIELALLEGMRIGVTQYILDEAEYVIGKYAKEHSDFIYKQFMSFFQVVGINLLQEPTKEKIEKFSNINKKDRPVVAAASAYQAILVSNDYGDLHEAEGVNVIKPEDFIAKKKSLDIVFPGVLGTTKEGVIHFKITSLPWNPSSFDNDPSKRVYFFDIPGLVSVFYKAGTRQLVCQNEEGNECRVSVENFSFPFNIAVAYRDYTSHLDFYVGNNKKVHNTKSVSESYRVDRRHQYFIGQSRYNKDQINGCILKGYSIGFFLKSKGVNEMISGFKSQDPWERDMLSTAIDYIVKGLN